MSARARRALTRTALPLGLLASALLVWHTSGAAFSATMTNPGNNWAAGTVAISDDDSGSALFTAGGASGLKPGSTDSRCIKATYTGTLTSAVKLYIGAFSVGSPNLAPYLRMTVEEGTGGDFSTCSGFSPAATPISGVLLSTLEAGSTGYASGYGAWTPTGTGQTQVYRITYVVDSAAPDSVQGGTATATFTWEARNT